MVDPASGQLIGVTQSSGLLSVTWQRPLAPATADDADLAGSLTDLIWGVHNPVPRCMDGCTSGCPSVCQYIGTMLQHASGDYGGVALARAQACRSRQQLETGERRQGRLNGVEARSPSPAEPALQE